jgi:hypothetical protein
MEFRVDDGVPCPFVKSITLQLVYDGNLDLSNKRMPEIPASGFLKYLKENPQIVQINDTLYFKFDRRLVYAKVVAIKYLRDVAYYEKVLDITDSEISKKFLPREMDIDVLSFNQYAGYLLEAEHLQSVELSEASFKHTSSLPCNSLHFRGILQTFNEPSYF